MDIETMQDRMIAVAERQASALERIANLLEVVVFPPEEKPTGCSHPQDSRIVLSGMGAREEWQCRDCGHHHAPEPVLKVD